MTATEHVDDELGWLLLARGLARRAGDVALQIRDGAGAAGGAAGGAALDVRQKSGETDLVTRADEAAQAAVFAGVRAAFPSHALLGEEGGEGTRLGGGTTWVVDAVDGTTNFVHGLLAWGVSIGVVRDGRVRVGVVYAPELGEVFSAVCGRGAVVNDRPMRVGAARALGEALVVSEWGYERGEGVAAMLAVNGALLRRGVRGVRQIGSGSLDMCYVGMGRVDAVYCGVGRGDAWKVWDYCAGALIAEEAGARLTDVRGGAFDIEGDSMVCAAPGVLAELLEVIDEGMAEVAAGEG